MNNTPSWGWVAFARNLKSEHSWGVGDFADIHQFATWAHSHGAHFVALGPTGYVHPGAPMDPSPYAASSRIEFDLALIYVPWIPGWEDLPKPTRNAYILRARDLNQQSVIELDAVIALKKKALEDIFFNARVDASKAPTEPSLFALFLTLQEQLGNDWRQWSKQYSNPELALRNKKDVDPRRVAYHDWCRQVAHLQMSRASAGGHLVMDLPAGFTHDGFDAWRWQQHVDAAHELGAPPDFFSKEGHRWGLAPVKSTDPLGVDSPFVESLRAITALSSGVRIDHALGLLRQFRIPLGQSPLAGQYHATSSSEVFRELDRLLHSLGKFAILELLGTAPAGFDPQQLEDFKTLYNLNPLFAEGAQPPGAHQALCITNHDLPTTAGILERMRTSAPLSNLEAIGATTLMRLLPGECPTVRGSVVSAYARLARSRAPLLLVPVEDALGQTVQLNFPGRTCSSSQDFIRRYPPTSAIAQDRYVLALINELGRSRP